MLKLGKSRKGGHYRHETTVYHRPGRIVSHNHRTVDASSWAVNCCHQECETNNEGSGGQIVIAEQAVVRFRLGYVTLARTGRNRFTPMFVCNDSMEYEVFAHANCAMDGGLNIEQLKTDTCSICDCHFYCAESPRETIVHVEHGVLNVDGQGYYEFEPGLGGYVHWACARHWWDDNLFEGLKGDQDGSTIEGPSKGDNED